MLMPQYLTDVTAISSKGQVVLPKAIRDALSLASGAKLMVMSDGESILLKPIRKPDFAEFKAMMAETEKWAAEVNMTEDDIENAIKEVRKARRSSK